MWRKYLEENNRLYPARDAIVGMSKVAVFKVGYYLTFYLLTHFYPLSARRNKGLLFAQLK
jgi:hypothetical protein